MDIIYNCENQWRVEVLGLARRCARERRGGFKITRQRKTTVSGTNVSDKSNAKSII
jgi:hypothetical protein